VTSPATVPTHDEVAAVVRELFGQELKIDPADIADDAVLKELPGADSVRLVRVVSRLERVFEARRFDELVTVMLSYLTDGNG
jgi:acyl carrier protein